MARPSLEPVPTPETAPRVASPVEGRIREVGEGLARTIGAILERLGALRPNALMRELDVNRAVASRVLNATAAKDPLEVVHLIPGPEPLRQIVRAAAGKGVDPDLVREAETAVAAFDRLIRNEAGTRSALDALISSSLPGARERFELASRYSVFKGISQLKGARAETWLGTAIVHPSARDPLKHDLTWLNGGIAMQRLRPGVAVRFSYRSNLDENDVERGAGDAALPDLMTLEQFCTNPPAQLEAHRSGRIINYVLPPDLLGPRSVTDLFVVDHHVATMRRYRKDEPRARTSLFVEPALPVALLVFDVLLDADVFPGAEPELVAFDTGYDGIANVNDPARDIDRMPLHEPIGFIGHDMRNVYATEVPGYTDVLAHLCARFQWDPARFRAYRVRIQYPVYGWQICMTFEPPAAP